MEKAENIMDLLEDIQKILIRGRDAETYRDNVHPNRMEYVEVSDRISWWLTHSNRADQTMTIGDLDQRIERLEIQTGRTLKIVKEIAREPGEE